MNRMKDIKRCRYIKVSASLFISLLLVGCGGGDSVVKPKTTNANRNTEVPQALYTEATTPDSIRKGAMHGMEIPSLKTGGIDALIVHTLPDGKLNYCIGYNSRLKENC